MGAVVSVFERTLPARSPAVTSVARAMRRGRGPNEFSARRGRETTPGTASSLGPSARDFEPEVVDLLFLGGVIDVEVPHGLLKGLHP
jgi:hypothetical protein